MAGRIRTVKPELLEDERTSSLSDAGFRLFVGAILLADDYGNLRANPAYLMGAVGASAGWDVAKAAEVSSELQRADLLTVYSIRGQRYAAIRGWDKHQRVDKPGKPRCPGPSDSEAVHEIRETLANVPGSSTTDLRPPTSESDLRDPNPTPKGTSDRVASRDAPPALASAQAGERTPQKPKRPRAEPTGDHHEFIRRFDALYAERTGGQKPLWNGKTGRHVAELLKRLELSELTRRAERLFRDPPAWLADEVPTMATLYSQINSLAADARPPAKKGQPGLFGRPRGLTGDDLLEAAARMRAEEEKQHGHE